MTFVITALYDLILRNFSYNYDNLPDIIKLDFIKFLQPYFRKHTLLAAGLIAGFIGSTTQVIILYFHKLPTNINSLLTFIITTFIISALYGFFIKLSNLFPYLVDTYYKKLGVFKSIYHDGISGLIVQITILILLNTIFTKT